MSPMPEHVEIDLYGRGFDGIFGHGAAEATKQQALRNMRAFQNFKANVKPGEYIDLDLYGRGDSSVFGKGAGTATAAQAEVGLQAAQDRVREGRSKRRVLDFPSGLKKISQRTRVLIRRFTISRKRRNHVSLEEDREQVFESVESMTAGSVMNTAARDARDEEDSVDPYDGYHDSVPRRVRSKLPSEEEPPHIEPGIVARVVRSMKSEESGSQVDTRGGDSLALTEMKSYPLQSIPSSGEWIAESRSDEENEAGESSDASDDSENESGIHSMLDGMDESMTLSFSGAQQAYSNDPAFRGRQSEYASTSSEEGLMAAGDAQGAASMMTGDRRLITRISTVDRLFESDDSDEFDTPERRGSLGRAHTSPEILEGDKPLFALSTAGPSPSKNGLGKDDSMKKDSSKSFNTKSSARDDDLHVTHDNDVVTEDAAQVEENSDSDFGKESEDSSIEFVNMGESTWEDEVEDGKGDHVERELSHGDVEKNSAEDTEVKAGASSEDQRGDGENSATGSQEVVDSDYSDQAGSSSEVVSTSSAEEDSDEIEIENTEEGSSNLGGSSGVEEGSEDREQVAESEDIIDPEAAMDDDENQEEETGAENNDAGPSFWQRLNIFSVLTG